MRLTILCLATLICSLNGVLGETNVESIGGRVDASDLDCIGARWMLTSIQLRRLFHPHIVSLMPKIAMGAS